MTTKKRVQELLAECRAIADDHRCPTERAQLRVRVRLAEIQSLLKAPKAKPLADFSDDFAEWLRLGAEPAKSDSIESLIASGNEFFRHGFK